MPSQSISLQELCRIASERTTTISEGATKLCDRCSNIRVQLGHDLPVSDEVIFLGPLKRIKERKNCPLCRLVVKSLPSDDTTADKGDIQCTLNPRHDCGETFALFSGKALKSTLKAYIRIEFPPGILEGFSNSSSPLHGLDSHRLREVVKKTLTIDFQKVQSWLHECEKKHGARCDGHEISQEFRDTEGLLLVDVVEERLVDGNQDSRYIALSYVWGGWGGAKVTLASWDSFDFLRTKGAFRSPTLQLPNVLRDAMSFVRSIGERYLWCDAICVFQDNRAQKYQQIAQMDIIYRRALLTIIALSGKHGNQTLPGVQKDSRQPIVSVSEAGGGVRFIARALNLTVLAAESIYESRAWTFQEKLLSRRCLMMTKNQVFFCCSLKCFREDEDLLDSPDQRLKRSKLYLHNAGLAAIQNSSDVFDLYTNLVKDYTNRNLTNPSDILDAFRGISKVLEGLLRDSFIMGLPRSHVHDALLWTPRSSIQIRPVLSIPSWSWAAYTGQICYHWPNSTDMMTRRETRHKSESMISEIFFVELDSLTFQALWPSDRVLQQPEDNRLVHWSMKDDRLKSFVSFVYSLLNTMHYYLHQHIPELGYEGASADYAFEEAWTMAEPIIQEFLDSHAWMIEKTPFSFMPSLCAFRYSLKSYHVCRNYGSRNPRILERITTPTDLRFWPFCRSDGDQQLCVTTSRRCTTCKSLKKPPEWTNKWIPSLSIFCKQLQPIITNTSPTCRLCFWAYTLPFDPVCLEGGQLFRNSFSMSSYLTTRDGNIQCDVATLKLATEPGVPAGQEIQPATIMWNPVIEGPYGIVLDNEDACISRISGRRCHLVLLSKCYIGRKELWQNCLIVAETTSGETLERIAVARAEKWSIERLNIMGTIKCVQLV